MSQSRDLTLTLRVLAAAADARRGIVRMHPAALTALGIRQWDAIELVGSRVTAAIAAAGSTDLAQSLCVVDEVIAANCGLTDDAPVVVRPAEVIGASEIVVSGPRHAQSSIGDRVLRSALLGKVARVGDSLTLLPRDLGPEFPTGETRRTLKNYLGASWTSQLVTVTETTPAGTVSVQPTTSVRWAEPAAHTPIAQRTDSAVPQRERAGAGSGSGNGASSASREPAASSSAAANSGTTARRGHHGGSSRGGIVDLIRTDVPSVPMSKLVGVTEQARTLRTWLELALDRAELLGSLGAAAQLGVLVTGPPGVGKSTLVSSVAGTRPVLAIDGPLAGSLAAEQRVEAIRDAVREACDSGGVLLITDIDGLLPLEPEPASTLILSALREVAASPGVALVATAVSAESLDARLRSPQLCDRILDMPLPDAQHRKELLEALLAEVPVGELELTDIARRTPGYVAGDLRALVREAALNAASRITVSDTASGEPEADSGGPETDAAAEAVGTDKAVDTDKAGDASLQPRIEQRDLDAALRVIRPMSRSGMEEAALGAITLDDVGDMAQTRQALTEAVLWPLNHPETFARLGVEPPRGVLLYGPPGCGKTFLVRALAASGQLTVHIVKGAELMDKWVGSSEKAVRELFRRARDSAPSLIFLDEVDALAPRRGQSTDSGVADRIVASLLTELDGAEPLRNVAVLAATNRPDLVDPALLRPGRLERLVFVPPPDAEARTAILRAAGRDVPLAEDVDLEALGADLEGYSGADCSALLREAAMTAMRRDLAAAEVTAADVAAARKTVRPSLDPVQVAALAAYAEQREQR